MLTTTLKRPSAYIPLAMSAAALALMLGHVAIYGIVRDTARSDEGAAAHIFQILMLAQLPVIAFFAIKWLPRIPRQALLIMALQAGAIILALAAVHFLT